MLCPLTTNGPKIGAISSIVRGSLRSVKAKSCNGTRRCRAAGKGTEELSVRIAPLSYVRPRRSAADCRYATGHAGRPLAANAVACPVAHACLLPVLRCMSHSAGESMRHLHRYRGSPALSRTAHRNRHGPRYLRPCLRADEQSRPPADHRSELAEITRSIEPITFTRTRNAGRCPKVRQSPARWPARRSQRSRSLSAPTLQSP